jgi:serine/threonine protein kinase
MHASVSRWKEAGARSPSTSSSHTTRTFVLGSCIPEHYVSVQLAGQGVDGEVCYCLPKHVVKQARNAAAVLPRSGVVGSLKSELVAVKTSAACLGREREIMLAIREQAGGDARRRHCIHLFESDLSASSFCSWLTLSTASGMFPLYNLCQADNFPSCYIPEELVFHIFIQIRDMLSFLHSCDQPIAHLDLHGGNVLVDPMRRDQSGFPMLLLIDFSRSIMPARPYDLVNDKWRLYRYVLGLAEHLTPFAITMEMDDEDEMLVDDASEWQVFCEYLSHWSAHYECSEGDVLPAMEDGWDAIRDMILLRISETPDATLRDIQTAVRRFADQGEKKLEESIAEVLR